MVSADIVRVREKGQITLPAAVRRAAHIQVGTVVEVSVTDTGAVILSPKVLVDAADAWYWAPEWQAGEREVDAEIARGDPGRVYSTDKEFLASLDE